MKDGSRCDTDNIEKSKAQYNVSNVSVFSVEVPAIMSPLKKFLYVETGYFFLFLNEIFNAWHS